MTYILHHYYYNSENTDNPTNQQPSREPPEASHPQGGQPARQPLGVTEMSCKVCLQRASGPWPPPSLLFYPLSLLCAT